jgi:hypothetical protein
MQIPFAIELTSEAPKKYLTPDIGQAYLTPDIGQALGS